MLTIIPCGHDYWGRGSTIILVVGKHPRRLGLRAEGWTSGFRR